MHIRIGMSEPYMTLRADPPPVQTEEAEVTEYRDRLEAGDYAGDGPEHDASAAKASADDNADDVAATAAAEAKAAELGVDLANVEGSGKGGKVTVGDVEAAAAPADAEADA